MIGLDPRRGSGDLLDLIKEPAEHRWLPWGDAEWLGNGREGRVYVGVEIKKVPDLLKCIVDKRLVGLQLPGMLDRYDVSYLIIEGGYRDGRKGLEVQFSSPIGVLWGHIPRGTTFLSYGAIDRFQTTLEELAGVVVRRTRDREETAAMLDSLHYWWQKRWTAHRGLKGTYHRTRRLVPR